MKMIIHLTFLLLVVSTVFSELTDYCNIPTCPDRTHTLCKYPEPGVSRRCNGTRPVTLGPREIYQIVNIHNSLREPLTTFDQRQLTGTDNDPPIPPLQWDEELSIIAERWATRCKKGYDVCRNVERFNVTQRVGSKKAFINQAQTSIQNVIWNWFQEHGVASLITLTNENLSLEDYDNANTKHQTRRVWGNATRIGCGAVKRFEKSISKLTLVCNYAPE